jgi:hypothetical protein
MSFANHTFSKNKSDAMPDSQQIIAGFASPPDCLTAHLMFESSEVLAGVKPANLISIVNRYRPCGRNLYQLWQQHNSDITTVRLITE